MAICAWSHHTRQCMLCFQPTTRCQPMTPPPRAPEPQPPSPHLCDHVRVELLVPRAQQGVGDVQPPAIKAAAVNSSRQHMQPQCDSTRGNKPLLCCVTSRASDHCTVLDTFLTAKPGHLETLQTSDVPPLPQGQSKHTPELQHLWSPLDLYTLHLCPAWLC
jgi:hypothetical protein